LAATLYQARPDVFPVCTADPIPTEMPTSEKIVCVFEVFFTEQIISLALIIYFFTFLILIISISHLDLGEWRKRWQEYEEEEICIGGKPI
jgi:hypothetical protein